MKPIAVIFILLFLAGCSSIKSHNEHLNDLIAAKKLQKDVDYAHRKLEKLHPKLYWYISKKELDHKFDSLKTTITTPMTRFAFYKKLSPVISAVREGHMYVYPPVKGYTKKQNDSIKKKGIGPLSQFEYELFDDKLYVVKNKSYDKTIKVGSEVISVNGINPGNYIKEYNHYYTSDGFNTTLKKNFAGTRFGTFFTYESGMRDSLQFAFQYRDTLKTTVIKRRVIDTAGLGKKNIPKKLTALEKSNKKATEKALKKKREKYGYDDNLKVFNRSLRFIEKDSSIAVMKIRGFTKGYPNDFYEESFRKIKECQSKTLILDLRNNGGGRLNEIVDLYSYMADSTFVFIDESEVVSKTSLFHIDYFKGGSVPFKALKIIFSPLFYGFTFFKVHQSDDGKYRYSMNSKPRKIKPDAFKGKIYVLINGGSFSASSILSSNLKGSKRAFFVGEETGGTYNGSVAGMLPLVKLPESGIKIRVGLIFIAPHYKTEEDGRGIFPDKEIIPTLADRIKNVDPEMEWVLDDIKTNVAPTAVTH